MFTIHSTNYKVNENCRSAITFCICFATSDYKATSDTNANSNANTIPMCMRALEQIYDLTKSNKNSLILMHHGNNHSTKWMAKNRLRMDFLSQICPHICTWSIKTQFKRWIIIRTEYVSLLKFFKAFEIL